jgi:hypothetical protein
VRIPEGDGMLGLASGALGQEIQPLPAAPGGLVPEDSVTREGEDRDQFSIRLSSGLREQLHRAASAADMPSVQAWAERVLADGAAHSLTLEGRLADTISTEVRRSLAKALEAGWYEGAIADVESESGLT